MEINKIHVILKTASTLIKSKLSYSSFAMKFFLKLPKYNKIRFCSIQYSLNMTFVWVLYGAHCQVNKTRIKNVRSAYFSLHDKA